MRTSYTSEKAIVSSKGQVVIPKSLRIALGIHAGTELVFKKANDTLLIKPTQRSIEMLFGCCKTKNDRPMTVEEIDKTIMQAVLEDDNKTLKQGAS